MAKTGAVRTSSASLRLVPGHGHRAHEAVAVRCVSRHLRAPCAAGRTPSAPAPRSWPSGSHSPAGAAPCPPGRHARTRPRGGSRRGGAGVGSLLDRGRGLRGSVRLLRPGPDPGYGPGRLLKAERLLPGVPGCRAGPCRGHGRGRGRGARYAKSPAPGSRGGAARGLFGGGSAVTGPGGSPRWPASRAGREPVRSAGMAAVRSRTVCAPGRRVRPVPGRPFAGPLGASR